MVADALVYHPSVSHYLKFVSTTVGRDKLLRTLQYFSRFYAWYLFRTNGTPAEIAPWEAIKKQFGLARKLMRVGKNVEHFKAAAIAVDSKSLDPVVKYCAVGRQLGYAGYLTFDMATVLDAAGIRKSPATKNLQTQAYRFWFMGLLFSTISGSYKLYSLRQQEGRINKEDGEGVVASKRIEKERAATGLQLLSDLCDICVPSSALGYTNLDDGIVGLAGTMSSLIGVYSQWKKTV
ncbi:hypothetical protein BP5796_03961 [Coleophoma crateriformis]|uniref:Peroxisomal membrane protein PMP27 n=1 Tax=Coleophoma crateriformis TaxID=565419 RepID=A0A3D8SH53_9HELO|nr:hypothetical protein BP5796_03961 [Coleophoma crateriformis]